ncbi:50S ribosomal protein L22 [Candidatus Berkelbacteria bacterium CG10_big_fil_rev_8_21_14_0_10_43_13]|uniref:Large ribosomal subunit protein uL22 n=1 Tax=Candidatus Berkelbacteria bacterium CG10_big_fil_rev_8_21_14_0_10_43_13 TaxID=1974514 RepID=A0A2H0W614_9BACT|nr:MAG: 50S ribosomal protein L22 [Candidatus Berkelbacteria bacterium CG10_big_fil_rev_8_21_14_0_10_43_13]
MEITVHNRNIRISPRKVRPVLHNMRGQSAEKVRDSLKFTNRKAAGFLHDLVKSGIAAGKENHIDAEQLMIKAVYCNEAPRLKRAIAWSKGQSRRITKRASHITLILESAEAPVSDAKTPITKKQTSKNTNNQETNIKNTVKNNKENKQTQE